MSSGFRVSVNPEIFIWARESAGLSVDAAAHGIGVGPDRLESWESGRASPTLAQLRSLAKTYRRPVALFYLPAPPEGYDPLRDYRMLPDLADPAPSPKLRFELRRVSEQREIMIELLDSGELPSAFEISAHVQDDPEVLAHHIRRWLDLDLQIQRRWSDGYAAMRSLTERVEARNILVFHISGIPLAEMRGCAISEQPFPLIVINGGDAIHGRLFTLFHELIHILLEVTTPSRGAANGEMERTARVRVEQFINKTAAAAMLPATALFNDEVVINHRNQASWSTEELLALSRRYHASQETVLRRLVTLGKASSAEYQARRSIFIADYEQLKERRRGEKGGGDYYRTHLRNLGRRYVVDVIDAYHRQAITAADLAGYLNMKLGNVPRLAELAGTAL